MSIQSERPNKLLEHAGRWLQSLVDRGRRSDGLLQSAQTWEAQYAAGKWDYLAELSELSRFSILAGYICHLKPGGAVLDTGCGQGALLRRLPSDSYSRYVGIDLSASAISVASKHQNERSTFLAADCENYSPRGAVPTAHRLQRSAVPTTPARSAADRGAIRAFPELRRSPSRVPMLGRPGQCHSTVATPAGVCHCR